MTQHRTRRALHAASMAAGVAAAFAAAAVLRGDGFARSTPRPPPGYVAAQASGYTLYAPSRQALLDGVEEIGHARDAFRGRFGVEPEPVVVVLADSPAAFRSLDLRALRRPGAGFVPFATRAHVASGAAGGDLLAMDGGALLKQVEGTARVVAAGRGEASWAGLRVRDEVVRVNGTAAAPLDSLRPRFEALPPGSVVRLELRRDGAPVRIQYRKGANDADAERGYAQAAARFRAEGKTLAHEVCHQFVAGEADRAPRPRSAPSGSYGHDALPDWWDEMAATLCESPAAAARRRAYLRASLGERIPLAVLSRMRHPVSVAMSVRRSGSAPASTEGLPVQVLRGEAARELLRDMNAPMFYAQSLSLGEFISERGGPAALSALTRSLASGRSLDESLHQTSRSAPSLPRSVEQLEAEWLRWFMAGDAR